MRSLPPWSLRIDCVCLFPLCLRKGKRVAAAKRQKLKKEKKAKAEDLKKRKRRKRQEVRTIAKAKEALSEPKAPNSKDKEPKSKLLLMYNLVRSYVSAIMEL
jgi:hypothetical protein